MWWIRSPTAVRISLLAVAAICRLSGQDEDAMRDFNQRLAEYQKLHKKAGADLPRLKATRSPKAIADHQYELARRIQAARASARTGDIFTPPIAAEFRRLIGIAMRGSYSRRIHQSLRHAEPVSLPLRVNDPYPTAVPLQSTPPSLLLNLPRLPQDLDYRIVGHSLVLRDVDADLIVDFIPEAIQ